MIGRAAMYNPWIFQWFKNHPPNPPAPSPSPFPPIMGRYTTPSTDAFDPAERVMKESLQVNTLPLSLTEVFEASQQYLKISRHFQSKYKYISWHTQNFQRLIKYLTFHYSPSPPSTEDLIRLEKQIYPISSSSSAQFQGCLETNLDVTHPDPKAELLLQRFGSYLNDRNINQMPLTLTEKELWKEQSKAFSKFGSG